MLLISETSLQTLTLKVSAGRGNPANEESGLLDIWLVLYNQIGEQGMCNLEYMEGVSLTLNMEMGPS